MKKWVIGLAALLIICLILAYSLFPEKIDVVHVARFAANANAVGRTLISQKLWNKVAPGRIRVTEPLANGVKITTSYHNKLYSGQLLIFPVTDTSSGLRWESGLPAATGPLVRVMRYFEALDLKRDMDSITQRIKVFCEVDSNTYGFHIKNESTTDTFLLATRFAIPHYPLTEEVYDNIGKLKKAAAAAGLKQTSFPMLNVTLDENNTYKCMVALPVDKRISRKGDIFFTRMEPGRFITAETRGGISTVQLGHDMVLTYIHDYKKLLMAMPFEHLLTDRMANKDTAEWITKLYYPVP